METNPVKVIRLKCLDCCCGSVEEVKLCPCQDCPLYPFRFGKNPYRSKKPLTDEQKEARKQALARAREVKNKIKADTL